MDRSMPYKDEPGVQDATVSDFLLPLLLSRLPLPKGAPAPAAGNIAGKVAQASDDVAGSELREAMMRSMSEPAKGFAMGGVVGGDLGQIPLPNEQPPGLPGMMGNAQNIGRQLYGSYTPERRNDIQAMFLQQANSMPSSIGSGLASVGDAIARGYGRNQSNFLDKTIQSQKDARAEGLAAFDAGQKGTLGMTQAGMEMGKMVPGGDLSKLAQEAYAGPLKKLGYTDEQISKMPASQIESVSQVALKFADIESQKELKEATLNLQSMMGNAQIRNQEAGRRQDAAKALSGRGIMTRMADAITGNPAPKMLEQEMNGGQAVSTPTVTSEDQYKALPSGSKFIWNGKEGIKP